MESALIAAYIALMVFIGIRAMMKIKNKDDFFIADRRGGLFYISGSLIATILGSSAILGTINLSYHMGWASSWLLVSGAIGLFALLPLSKKVRRFGKYTLPQMIGDFYGETAQNLSSILIPIAWIGVIVAQIIGSAQILTAFIGLSYTTSAIISGMVFILYTVIGGQFSILKTDFIQTIFILGGFLILAIFLYHTTDIPLSNLSNQSYPFNNNFKTFDLIVLLFTYSSTFFVGPDIYSRLFSAKDEKTAFNSVLITAIVILLMAFLLSFIGVYSAYHFPEISQHNSTSLVSIIQTHFPFWLSGVVVAAMLSAVMSSAATTLLTASTIVGEQLKIKSLSYDIHYTRIIIVVFGAISILFATIITSIVNSLLLSLSFYSGAFIIPVAAGLLGWRTSNSISITAILTGGMTAFIGKLCLLYIPDSSIGYIFIFGAFILNAGILFLPDLIIKRTKP